VDHTTTASAGREIARQAPADPVVPATPVATATPTAAPAPGRIERSRPDQWMRRMLRVPDLAKPVPESDTHRIFGASILLSATRCLLSYIVLPVILPAIGLAKGVGPYIGIPIGVLALTFDFLGIRRFWMADHHQKWLFSAIYAVVGAMVLVLLVVDIVDLLG
jgi:hypothetical protein